MQYQIKKPSHRDSDGQPDYESIPESNQEKNQRSRIPRETHTPLIGARYNRDIRSRDTSANIIENSARNIDTSAGIISPAAPALTPNTSIEKKATTVSKEKPKKKRKFFEHKYTLRNVEEKMKEADEEWEKQRYVVINMFDKDYNYNRKGVGLDYKNWFRSKIIWVNEWWHFDAFIFVCIIANSLLLASYDYKNKSSNWNKNVDIIGHVFSAIFIIEALVKTIAQGFIFGNYAYLKEGWNVLDFLIVVAGIVELLLQDTSFNVKVIRTLRILRPLKTINAIPEIRIQVSTLIQSLPHLATVALFLGFMFLMYGILGLQLFQGYIYGKCRLTEKPQNATYWAFDPDNLRTCSVYGQGIHKCPNEQICGIPQEYGISVEDDYVTNNAAVQYGVSSFDNIFQSVLAVFQIITNDSWTTILFNLQDSTNEYLSTFFCCSIVLVCSYFSLNLVLAVIMESFQKYQVSESKREVENYERQESKRLTTENRKTTLVDEKLEEKTSQQQIEKLMDERGQRRALIERLQAANKVQVEYVKAQRKQNPSQGLGGLMGKMQNMLIRKTNAQDQPKKMEFKEGMSLAEVLMQARRQKEQQEQPLSLGQILLKAREEKERLEREKQQLMSQGMSLGQVLQRAKQLKDQEEAKKKEENLSLGQILMKFKAEKDQQEAQQRIEEMKKEKDEQSMSLGQILAKAKKEKEEQEKRQKLAQTQSVKPMSLGQILAKAKAEKAREKEEKKLQSSQKSAPSLGSLLFSSMKQGQQKKIDKQNTGMGISLFTKILRDEAKHDENPLIELVRQRMAAVLEIDNINDRILERQKLINTNQTLLTRMEMALKKKFIENKRNDYGVGNEGNIMPQIREQCQAQLELKKSGATSLIGNYLKSKIDENKRLQSMQVNVHKALKERFLQNQKNLSLQSDKEKEIRERIKSSMQLFFKENLSDRYRIKKIQEENLENQRRDLFIQRAKGNCLYLGSHKLTSNPWFEYMINLAIIANTAILAMDSYPESKQTSDIIETSNLVFFAIFAAEMLLKLVAYGFRGYFTDRFNCFDAFIVFISTIDVGINSSIQTQQVESGGAITALRAFRLLRVFKLAKTWDQLQNLLSTISSTLISVGYFSVLLFLLIFVYTILGMDLFAYKAKFNDDDEIDLRNGSFPDSTFNYFLQGFLSVFIVLANDGWSTIYFHYYRSVSPITSTLFFISLLFVGQYILLNLFLAILIDRFEIDSQNSAARKQEEKLRKKALDQKTFVQQTKDVLKRVFCDLNCKKIRKNLAQRKMRNFKMNNMYDEQLDTEVLADPMSSNISLGYFRLDNPLRKLLRRFILPGSEELVSLMSRMQTRQKILERKTTVLDIDKATSKQIEEIENLQEDSQDKEAKELEEKPATAEYVILLLIIISSVLLALENPLNDPDGELAYILFIMDIILTFLFTFEAFAKIVAFGFLFNGSESYIRKIWNQVDFIIVVMSIVDLFIEMKISFFKVIRLFRVLRPLRVISRNEGLKISIQALIISIPAVFNVIMITFLFFLIFGIVGVNYMKGMYNRCEHQIIPGDINDIFDCLNYGAMWKNFPANFDKTSNGILTLFSMANVVGWADIMYRGMASRGPDLQPIQNSQPFISLFYIFFMIVGCFFMINLFVGVVISNYNREKDDLGKLFLLTSEQKKWLEAKMLVIRAQPILSFVRPDEDEASKIRIICYDIVMNDFFEKFIMSCIFLNTILLACSFYGQPSQYTIITEIINLIFLGFFTIEAVLKLIAFKLRYFRESWNTFDLLIVIGAYIGVMISAYSKVSVGPAATTIRAFRIARIVKLFRNNRKLTVVFRTFMTTLPAMANVGGLMMLFVYIYAVLGVFLFAPIKHNGHLTIHVNFENIGNAMLTLFRVSTGENWHLVLAALYQRKALDYQCIENPDFDDYKAAGNHPVGCGSSSIPIIYFASFVLLVILIFLNLFIAIILSAFNDSSEEDAKVFNQDVKDQFRKYWSYFDPDATSFIKLSQFGEFLMQLGKPLGIGDSDYYRNNPKEEKEYVIQLVDIMGTYEPEEGKDEPRVNFLDVLECLTMQFILKEEFKRQIEEEKDQGVGFIKDMMGKMKKAEDEKTILNHDINKLKEKKEKKERKKRKKKGIKEAQKLSSREGSSRTSLASPADSPTFRMRAKNGQVFQKRASQEFFDLNAQGESSLRIKVKETENSENEEEKKEMLEENSSSFESSSAFSSSEQEEEKEETPKLGAKKHLEMNVIMEDQHEASVSEIQVEMHNKLSFVSPTKEDQPSFSLEIQNEGSHRVVTEPFLVDSFSKELKILTQRKKITPAQLYDIMNVKVPKGESEKSVSLDMFTDA